MSTNLYTNNVICKICGQSVIIAYLQKHLIEIHNMSYSEYSDLINTTKKSKKTKNVK